MGMSDNSDDVEGRILSLAGPSIAREICHHFTDMTSFRLLRSGDSDIIGRKRPWQSVLKSGAPHNFDVSVEECTTRVVSCLKCCVLRGYCVLWAESTLRVATRSVRYHTPKEIHSLRLLSLHIVDLSTSQEANPHPQDQSLSFALQSVSRPDRKEQLECYPRHMIHFGYLMHAKWNSSGRPTQAPREANTAVLILGLGGNVIGNYLNTALPADVSIDVVELEPAVLDMCRQQKQVPPLSKIEEEGDKREESEQREKTGEGDPKDQTERVGDNGAKEEMTHLCSVYSVDPGHERYGHYRFILGDARDALRHATSPLQKQYSIVFLDCYDPERERMMHDEDLVDLCRSRLCPGGAVVVNAHIPPTREELDAPFLSRDFASVQALRVSGYNQSIIVCLAPGVKCGKGEFDVRQIRQMAREKSGQFFRDGFTLDADWLKSSRAIESGSGTTLRVWEHYE